MGFLDALAGRSARKPAQEEAAAEQQQSEQRAAAAVGEPTTSLPHAELLRDAAPAGGVGGFSSPSGRLYDPYQGLGQQIGGPKRVAFQLPEGPEFVFQEEAAVHRRGWGENLQFYTGLGYLGGGATGFAIGGYRYLRMPKDPALLDSAKLRANRLLNTGGSIGRQMACGSAVLGLYFASIESAILALAAGGPLPDAACTMLAGFSTAALYRSPRGPRAAAISGAVGAVIAGALAAARQKFPSL